MSRLVVFLTLALIFLQTSGDIYSIAKRYSLVNDSLIILQQNIVFGVGLGNYLYYQSLIPSLYPYALNQPVHNIFLLFVSQVGVIISLFSGYYLFRFVKNNRKSLTFIICLTIVILTGMADHYWLTLQQNLLLLGIVFGILLKKTDVGNGNF